MSRANTYNLGRGFDVKKLYIITKPTRIEDLNFYDEHGTDNTDGWREKARRLQVRRWRKIRHQLN